MESEAQPIRYPPESSSMTCSRVFPLCSVKALYVIWVSWCIFFHHAVSGPYLIKGTQETKEEKDKYGFLSSDCDSVFTNSMPCDATIGTVSENSDAHATLSSAGGNPGMMLFPSTLSGSSHGNINWRASKPDIEISASKLSDQSVIGSAGRFQGPFEPSNSSWFSDYGVSNSLGGRTVSCYLNSIQEASRWSQHQTSSTNKNDLSSCRGPLFNSKVSSGRPTKNHETVLSSSMDGALPDRIEIDPPMLDWGEKYLYIPSLIYLTVLNTWNDSVLHVYQPFSTDSQFFPCNFTEAILEPGEGTSICFVFLPKSLGLSSGHLILQTSYGGFLVQTKGFAAEFPYGQFLPDSAISSIGRWKNNFSIFNPFEETIFVEEIAMWVSISLGNTTLHVDATCSALECNYWDFSDCNLRSIKDWFLVKGGHADSSLMAMRPLSNWEIGPRTVEPVAEIDLSFGSLGRISGALCLRLVKPSQHEADIVMLPLEAEIDRPSTDDVDGLLTFSLERAASLAGGEGILAVSLRNTLSNVVSVQKITVVANSEPLQIKYMEGLLLFPRTTTKVALVSCISPEEVLGVNRNCKILVQTNDSRSPVEIHCDNLVHLCPKEQDSSVGRESSPLDVSIENTRTRPLTLGTDLLHHAMALETTDLDKLVLENWKSQGTEPEASVLEDHVLLFSMVQVGDHLKKWITVRNPSQQPIVIQLILNPAEIMDDCQTLVKILRPVSSAGLVQPNSISPRRYGFSLPDGARTEAFVHPHGTSSLGPVIFHPSNRCKWQSSALIRNNLTGVEWISLQGRGGSSSLALVENSEPVEILDFTLEMPQSLNFSLLNVRAKTEDINRACSRPVIKELYAENTGDFPLDVRYIRVSGTNCGSGRFLVQNCSHFVLKPGQSRMLLVSYMSDFSGPLVRGDLELALGSGIIVIPMRASVPAYTLDLCKKSLFWTWVKKALRGFLVVAPVLCLALFSVFSPWVPFYSRVLHYKGKCDSVGILTTVRTSSPSAKGEKKIGKFIPPSPKVNPFPTVDEEELLVSGLVKCVSNHQSTSQDPIVCGHHSSHIDNRKEREPLNSISSESGNVVEPSQLGKLTVKIGKEKGRKRRKRKGPGNALTGLFEVSSSHSGNSTPSSPLSPISSVTPRRIWPMSPDGDKTPLLNAGSGQETTDPVDPVCSERYRFAPQEQHRPVPRKTVNKPVLLPSATFPCAGRQHPSPDTPFTSYLSSNATIAPHARAPGSKLRGENDIKPERSQSENLFTYDIWGDHLSRLKLLGGASVDDSAVVPRTMNSDSHSFFVRGPQALMTTYRKESVSFKDAVNGEVE